MILLDRVTKNYGKSNKPALNRASIHVSAGEFVIIVGTSGAGKSTLLKLLTREEKPSSGKIVVGGIDYDTLKDKHIPLLRRKIGVVFQDFKLLPNRTVFENIAFALEIAGILGVSEEGWEVVKKYIQNAHIYTEGEDHRTAIIEGKYKYGQMWGNGLLQLEKERNVKMQFMQPEIGMPFVSEHLGIVKNSKKAELAEEFIN